MAITNGTRSVLGVLVRTLKNRRVLYREDVKYIVDFLEVLQEEINSQMEDGNI